MRPRGNLCARGSGRTAVSAVSTVSTVSAISAGAAVSTVPSVSAQLRMLHAGSVWLLEMSSD